MKLPSLTFPLMMAVITLVFFSACKKDNKSGWSDEDWTFYHNVIALQDTAAVKWTNWLQTMDSLEAVNELQQFFLSDPSVTSATIGSQGIAVQYSNGIRGGFFLNPQDDPGGDELNLEPEMMMPASNLIEKSLVKNKKVIFINPHSFDRGEYNQKIKNKYNEVLPKVGFTLKDEDIHNYLGADLKFFTQLSGYGIIHIYSHGMAWPDEEHIQEVYVMTGEIVSDDITEKYQDEIKSGEIIICNAHFGNAPYGKQYNDLYWISEKFIANKNDFSKDTVLFYGGFCYSMLGNWDQLYKKFAKGSYFGFDWVVRSTYCNNWFASLADSLCDTSAKIPYNAGKWILGPSIPKSYVDDLGKTVNIRCVGDSSLALWGDSIQIGAFYQGGIIFYIDGTGKHGLIVDSVDTFTNAPWGCQGTSIQGTSTALGTGLANTIAIINECDETGIAARVCYDLVLNGYSDWFLPSRDELKELYLQRNVLGGFIAGFYYSSSEYDED
ncbi:MAG: hypothetical protein HGA37_18185, partial [Lentimicrobium sp.]|nr:hypothetical protein [Lentimicrobium sp.]